MITESEGVIPSAVCNACNCVSNSYSWNDQEPVAAFYETAEEAFRAACHLAAEEAYVQNEDMLPEGNVVVTFDAGQYAIDLEYRGYMTGYCYYRVFEFCETCGLVSYFYSVHIS